MQMIKLKIPWCYCIRKVANANKETEETMKVLETDKSIADKEIDKVCQEKEESTKKFTFCTWKREENY